MVSGFPSYLSVTHYQAIAPWFFPVTVIWWGTNTDHRTCKTGPYVSCIIYHVYCIPYTCILYTDCILYRYIIIKSYILTLYTENVSCILYLYHEPAVCNDCISIMILLNLTELNFSLELNLELGISNIRIESEYWMSSHVNCYPCSFWVPLTLALAFAFQIPKSFAFRCTDKDCKEKRARITFQGEAQCIPWEMLQQGWNREVAMGHKLTVSQSVDLRFDLLFSGLLLFDFHFACSQLIMLLTYLPASHGVERVWVWVWRHFMMIKNITCSKKCDQDQYNYPPLLDPVESTQSHAT